MSTARAGGGEQTLFLSISISLQWQSGNPVRIANIQFVSVCVCVSLCVGVWFYTTITAIKGAQKITLAVSMMYSPVGVHLIELPVDDLLVLVADRVHLPGVVHPPVLRPHQLQHLGDELCAVALIEH